MTIGLSLMSKLSRLSEEQQRVVLEYVEKLGAGTAKGMLDPHGICADLRSDLSWDEFQRNRQEMWGAATDSEL